MMKDPRKACSNLEERLFWALVHDGIAHPLMALTLYLWKPAIRFHDWTSHRAWPRQSNRIEVGSVLRTNFKELAFAYAAKLKLNGVPHVTRSIPQGDGFLYEVEEIIFDQK